MWDLLTQWYNENRVLVGLFLLISIGIGLLITGACFFFPSLLVNLASLTFWGMTPLAFLPMIQLPLALLVLGAITTTAAFAVGIGGSLIVNQLVSMGGHLWSLFAKETTTPKEQPMNESYSYLQTHLRTTSDYVEEVFDEDYEEISSSNSCEQEELRSSSTYSHSSPSSSLRSGVDDEHSTFISFPRCGTI
ncbi:hypothetical protein [Legionella fallonii]|uniref:Uncharacterized protein n=1 Tax=Legionella fallonii LLAP-10 TaxID=1212491 RepID=A0A098GAA1_9GAMM|nr:hypothetical protein [Legionella fallonii]CEG58945.1 membrane protein of unknown function [Legionella fallonii LLAP-10]